MTLVGCDLHSRTQLVAVLDTTAGEVLEHELAHDGVAVERFYRALRPPVTIGIETTGYTHWWTFAVGFTLDACRSNTEDVNQRSAETTLTRMLGGPSLDYLVGAEERGPKHAVSPREVRTVQ